VLRSHRPNDNPRVRYVGVSGPSAPRCLLDQRAKLPRSGRNRRLYTGVLIQPFPDRDRLIASLVHAAEETGGLGRRLQRGGGRYHTFANRKQVVPPLRLLRIFHPPCPVSEVVACSERVRMVGPQNALLIGQK
jgi:hypothetical protein